MESRYPTNDTLHPVESLAAVVDFSVYDITGGAQGDKANKEDINELLVKQ
jgi:hypothetical protein